MSARQSKPKQKNLSCSNLYSLGGSFFVRLARFTQSLNWVTHIDEMLMHCKVRYNGFLSVNLQERQITTLKTALTDSR